jgi:putative toxin-antitoxin system antitoxin component (TIGR02293 family)
MTEMPLAEAYEKLKELRRKGDSGSDDARLFDNVREFQVARKYLEAALAIYAATSEALLRAIEIKTLADRIFGDSKKADDWLRRPNTSLSGQRPIDLSKDELGAAVVREMLERIDHGIFA